MRRELCDSKHATATAPEVVSQFKSQRLEMDHMDIDKVPNRTIRSSFCFGVWLESQNLNSPLMMSDFLNY